MESFLGSIQLLQFSHTEIALSMLIFMWTGFVRTGLGFGGAALGLPLMLFIFDRPLFWLPVIGSHLLFFTSLTLLTRLKAVDWSYLKKSSLYIMPAMLIGVFGLLNLPNNWLVLIIYSITLFYSILWLLDIRIQSEKGWTDKLLLIFGGYVSGTSLTGAPLLVAVYMHHVSKLQLRNTLFVLWFILVTIKMATFVAFGFDLHTKSALMLLPAAAVGHILGLKLHDYILQNDAFFKRFIGAMLAAISLIGFSSLL